MEDKLEEMADERETAGIWKTVGGAAMIVTGTVAIIASAGELTFRSGIVMLGKEGVSTLAGYGASNLVYDKTNNQTLGMIAGILASMGSAKGLNMADAKLGWSNKGVKGNVVESVTGDIESGRETNIDGAINNGQPLNNHRIVPNTDASSLPATKQTPNSSADLLNPDGSVKQRRYYDADGKAQMDIDFNHTDDGTHEFPHIHIWD